MLSQTTSSKRKRTPTNLLPSVTSKPHVRTQRKNGRFVHQKNKTSYGYYVQYAIFGFIAIVLCTTIIIAYSFFFSSTNHKQEAIIEKPLTEDEIKTFEKINAMIRSNPLKGNIFGGNNDNNILFSQLSHLDIYNNQDTAADSVELTFSIYSNDNCDDSNPDNFVTVKKASNQIALDGKDDGSLTDDCPLCYKFCGKKFNDKGSNLNQRGYVKSIKIHTDDPNMYSNGQIDLYSDCQLNNYHSSIYAFEGCVHLYDWPSTAGMRVIGNYLDTKQSMPSEISLSQYPPLQEHLIKDGITRKDTYKGDEDIPSYTIVYSCESSEYCAFQAQANFYGYLTSNQHPLKSSTLRLLTAQEPDDMCSYIPTFVAPRNQYSRRYSPYNKADVLVKWYESPLNSPYSMDSEMIVVIDPDNWIIRDITHWVVQAKKGHALGEAAWFNGNNLVKSLWKEVCVANCDWTLDMVGVPYIVHRDDLKVIAPLFKMYIILMKEKEEKDKEFLNRYKGIQMGWGTEMFAYIFAAAHAGIKHEVVHGIQRRDVSGRPKNAEEERGIDMIHMGRAWFPRDYEEAKIWWHTEGSAWKRFGAQVWCKCNYTASDIIPWPLPPCGRDCVDFQSYHTLYLLHYGREYFGELPSSKYRKPGKAYHTPYP